MATVINLPFLIETEDGNPVSQSAQGWWYKDDVVSVRGSSPAHPITGWRDPSPYDRLIENQRVPMCFGVSQRTRYGQEQAGYKFSGPLPLNGGGHAGFPGLGTERSVRAHEIALLKCMTEFTDSPVDLGVMLGERRESMQFVGDTLHYAADMVRAIKKKDLRRIKQLLLGQQRRQRHYKSTLHEVLDAPSSAWLANSYAIKPMAADIYGTLEALDTRENTRPPHVKKEASHTEKYVYLQSSSSIVVSSVYWPILRTWTDSHRAKVRLDAELENDLLFKLNQVGAVNPLGLAWDLLPLSFVADWALPIGDYFRALNAFAGLSFKGGSVTRSVVRKVDWSVGEPYVMGSSSWGVSNNTFLSLDVEKVPSTNKWMHRLVLTEFPSPPAPRFKNPLSPAHILSGIALLTKLTS